MTFWWFLLWCGPHCVSYKNGYPLFLGWSRLFLLWSFSNNWKIQITMSSGNNSVSCSPSPPSSVHNTMDLDAFFSVTRDNIDFSKACSLVKTDQTIYIEDKFHHQLNLSIQYHETEIARQQTIAQQVLTKHFSWPTTIDEHVYLVNKYDRRQRKKEQHQKGLWCPYVKKPYFKVSVRGHPSKLIPIMKSDDPAPTFYIPPHHRWVQEESL